VSWQAIGYPDHYLRQYAGAVWVAGDGGALASDTTAGWAQDTSWTTAAPWAP